MDSPGDCPDRGIPVGDRPPSHRPEVCPLHQVHHRQVCDESGPALFLLQVAECVPSHQSCPRPHDNQFQGNGMFTFYDLITTLRLRFFEKILMKTN